METAPKEHVHGDGCKHEGEDKKLSPEEQKKAQKEFEKYMQAFKDPIQRAQLKKQMEIQSLASPHKFWETQPIANLTELRSTPPTTNEPIVALEVKPKDGKEKEEEVKAPEGYEWRPVNLLNKDELKAIFDFLAENYIEDIDGAFRPYYSLESLSWMLHSPDAIGKWHLVLVESANKKIRGFIAATPTMVNIKGKVIKTAIINLLCVDKSLKSKRFAPVLISELKRRVNLRGVAQAIYSIKKIYPTPMIQVPYFHRIIDVKTLLKAGYLTLSSKMTQKTMEKMHSLHEISVPYFRQFRKKDKKAVAELLNSAYSGCEIAPVFDENNASYMFAPQKEMMQAFVVEENSKITDFMSYYILPAAVQTKEPLIKEIKIAYLYYYAVNKVGFESMLKQILLCAQKDGCALFSALATRGIEESLVKAQFNQGIDYTNFYLYNWKTSMITSSKFGLILP